MKYAVLSLTAPDEKLEKVIRKAGAILGRKFTLSTTVDSEMNLMFYEAHKGSKELYSEEPKSETGLPVTVNPTFGNLRSFAMKEVKGFFKLTPRHKSLVYSTLACLYGLEGKSNKTNPYLKAKFVITYLDPTHPSHNEHEYCVLLAKKLGFKVIDLADNKGREAFGLILRKLSA